MSRRHTATVVAGLLLLGAGTTACGSSSSTSAGTSALTPATTVTASTPTTAAATPTAHHGGTSADGPNLHTVEGLRQIEQRAQAALAAELGTASSAATVNCSAAAWPAASTDHLECVVIDAQTGERYRAEVHLPALGSPAAVAVTLTELLA